MEICRDQAMALVGDAPSDLATPLTGLEQSVKNATVEVRRGFVRKVCLGFGACVASLKRLRLKPFGASDAKRRSAVACGSRRCHGPECGMDVTQREEQVLTADDTVASLGLVFVALPPLPPPPMIVKTVHRGTWADNQGRLGGLI